MMEEGRQGSRPRRLPGRRWFAWGVVIGFFYIVTVAIGLDHLPVRILYDGFAPLPPYRWVRPPANHLGLNEPPAGGSGAIELHGKSSEAVSLATDDGQAVLIVPRDGVVPRPGELLAEVTFTPLDPESLAPPPPGLRFDGNAYRITGVYRTSKASLAFRKQVTVVLRYPVDVTELLQDSGSEWVVVRKDAGVVDASMQVYASTDQLGIFVAAGPLSRPRSTAGLAYGLAAFGLIVMVVGVLLSRRRRRRR